MTSLNSLTQLKLLLSIVRRYSATNTELQQIEPHQYGHLSPYLYNYCRLTPDELLPYKALVKQHTVEQLQQLKLNYKGHKSLLIAAKSDNREAVQHLSADAERDSLNRALVLAVKYGHEQTAQILLDCSADVNEYCNEAIMWASVNGHSGMIKLLIQYGADVEGFQPLHEASRFGHTEAAKVLLDGGADIHSIAGDEGALKLAYLSGHTEMVELLLERGANMHALDDV